MSPKRHSEEGGVHLRTRKKRRALDYKGSATIQDIPVEVMWKIVDYLDHDSFLILRNMCLVFSKTLTVMFFHFYKTIPCKISTVRKLLSEKLYSSSLGEEAQRLDVTKSLLYLDWLETEMVTLESIMWRYNVTAESDLFPELWPILKEIANRIESLTKSVPFSDMMADIRVLNPASSLPLWSKFIEQFDQSLEPTLGRPFPFETRVVDILTCCPSSNISVAVKCSQKDDTVGLKAFFQIQDSCSEKFNPAGSTDEDYERSILKFLRFIVRTRNSLYMTNMFDDIRNLECRVISSFLNEIDRNNVVVLLENRYRGLDSPIYEPFISFEDKKDGLNCFVRRSTYNVSSNFLECSLENNSLHPTEVPLIAVYPQLFRGESVHSTFFDSLNSTINENKTYSAAAQEFDEVDSPFKLRVFFKNWWEDVNILITKNQRRPQESETSFIFAQDVNLHNAREE